MITIRPKQVNSFNYWRPKIMGVIFVKEESHIEKVYELLCIQDDYWEGMKSLIKVAPIEIGSEKELEKYCEYVFKTDIYDIPKLINDLAEFGIEILIFQYQPEI